MAGRELTTWDVVHRRPWLCGAARPAVERWPAAVNGSGGGCEVRRHSVVLALTVLMAGR